MLRLLLASVAKFLLGFAWFVRSLPMIVEISGCETPLKSVQGSLMIKVDVKPGYIDALSKIFVIWKDWKTAAWKWENTMLFETTGGERVDKKEKPISLMLNETLCRILNVEFGETCVWSS